MQESNLNYLPILCARCGEECGSVGMGAAYAHEDQWLCEDHIHHARREEVKEGVRVSKRLDRRQGMVN